MRALEKIESVIGRKLNLRVIPTRIGEMVLAADSNKLWVADWADSVDSRLDVWRRVSRGINSDCEENLASRGTELYFPEFSFEESSRILDLAEMQIKDYLAGKIKGFSIPISPVGTTLQLRVWQELSRIPYGAVISYKELAKRVGNPRAVRAVASACRANALSLFIPCHRVIASDGSLGGYAGGVPAKLSLLSLELGANHNLSEMVTRQI